MVRKVLLIGGIFSSLLYVFGIDVIVPLRIKRLRELLTMCRVTH